MARQALIKLRRGSGAPVDGTLTEGELAIDIAAGKLYTANATGNTQILSGDLYNLSATGNSSQGVVTLTVDNAGLSNDSVVFTGGDDIIVAGNSSTINVKSVSTLSSITARGATTSTLITGNGGFAGDLTGDVTGDLTGDVTGNVSGNAGTVTNGVYTTDTGTVTNTMLAGSIANAKLLNSAVTVGSTSVSLGATATTLTGLTSVTSTDFVGDLTGDVTGNLTGNVTGDVTGDLTGDVTGDVTGDLTGDVTGNVTGNLTGNVTGDVTGSISGGTVSGSTGTFSGNVTVSGDLTVSGTTTQINSTIVTIDDNLIKLAANQTATDADAVDTGFYSTFDVGGTQKYSGFFRDTSSATKAFVFFEGITGEPGTSVSYTSSELAHIEAVIDGGSY
jgi:hypothetical protein